MKVTVYIATSLDGFIAREDGALDWLPPGPGLEGEEDYGYKSLMDTVDTVVMGRHTFEKVLTLGDWHYKNKHVVVLTTHGVTIPPELADFVDVMSGPPENIVARLAVQGDRHLYVDGGKTIQEFLKAGAVHRIILTRVPILIGHGIPLFGPLSQDILLRHVQSHAYSSGLVQSEYEVLP